jgi:hypothetical protein
MKCIRHCKETGRFDDQTSEDEQLERLGFRPAKGQGCMVLCRVGMLVLWLSVMSMGQVKRVLMSVLVQGRRAMTDLKVGTPVRVVNSQVVGQTEGGSQQ